MPGKKKLRLELIPGPLWRLNLRSNVVGIGPGRWLKTQQGDQGALGQMYDLRRDRPSAWSRKLEVRRKTSQRCRHFGRHRRDLYNLSFRFSTGDGIQQLVAIGVMSAADEGRLIRHFMKVNKCTRAAFERHVVRSFRVWRVRSKKKWKIDWSDFEPMIIEAKAARDIHRRRREAAAERRTIRQISSST